MDTLDGTEPLFCSFLAHLHRVIAPHNYPLHYELFWLSQPKQTLRDERKGFNDKSLALLWDIFLRTKTLTEADLAPFKRKE